MTMSVDPLRGPQGPRRARKADSEKDRADLAQETEASLLPVPVGPPRTIPSGSARIAGAAAIDAQVIGERRGLRAGPTIHDEARRSYNHTKWSGAYDRRAPKGRVASSQI